MKSNCNQLLVLRGAPGCGKSTLARALRDWLPNGFLVEVDAVRGMRHAVDWVGTEEHLASLDAVAAIAKVYVQRGYGPGVIADHLLADELAYLCEQLEPCGICYTVCTLIAEPATLEDHMLRRRKDGVRDWRVAASIDAAVRAEALRAGELRVAVEGFAKGDIPAILQQWCRQFG